MQSTNRNNVIAGLFLVLALLLAVVMSFVLSGINLKPTTTYSIKYDLKEGADGLQPGSVVKIGGVEAGEVKEIQIQRDPVGAPTNLLVELEIDSGYTLYEDVKVELVKPLLGSISSINIVDVGGGEGGSTNRLTSDSLPADGRVAAPSFLADAGLGNEDIEDIKQKITSILDDSDARVTAVSEEDIETVMADTKAAVASARRTIEQMGEDYPGWDEKLDATLDNTRDVSARMKDRFPPFMDNLDTTVTRGQEAVTTFKGMLDENRADVRATTENAREITRVAREQTMPAINEAVAKGDDVLAEARSFLREQRPNLERTTANLRLSADQLKLFMLEVRAQPWRLLQRPETKEMETQLLYDAARSMAVAASDLRAATSTLATMSEGPTSALDQERLGALHEQLNDSVTKYRQAEDQLLDRLIQQP